MQFYLCVSCKVLSDRHTAVVYYADDTIRVKKTQKIFKKK